MKIIIKKELLELKKINNKKLKGLRIETERKINEIKK